MVSREKDIEIKQRLSWRSLLLLLLPLLPIVLTGCVSSGKSPMGWHAQRIAQVPMASVALRDTKGKTVARISRDGVRHLLSIKSRLENTMRHRSEMLIIQGKRPNAHAWIDDKGRAMIAMNLGMIEFLAGDVDGAAFVIGHELAHNVRRHTVAGRKVDQGVDAVSLVLGWGLSMAGVPFGDTAVNLGATLIKTNYSRDQEREADEIGLRAMMAAGFNPQGAIRFHQRMSQAGDSISLPFFSTHPTSAERIANMRRIIAQKR